MRFKKLLSVLFFIFCFIAFSYFLFDKVPLENVLESVGFSKYILIPLISIFGNNLLTSSLLYPILFSLNYEGINFIVLAILAAIGGTIGDSLFVFFGRRINGGTQKEKKIFSFFKRNKESPFIRIFIFIYAAFIPMSNELMTLALGYVKYPFKKIITPLFLGNIVYYSILIGIGGSIWTLLFSL